MPIQRYITLIVIVNATGRLALIVTALSFVAWTMEANPSIVWVECDVILAIRRLPARILAR